MIPFNEYYILEEGGNLDNVKKWAKRAGMTVAAILALIAGWKLADIVYKQDPLLDPEKSKRIIELIHQMERDAMRRGAPNLPPLPGQAPAADADANATANPVANNIQAIMDYIQGEEGIRLDSYDDHLGNRTVGIGHLMTRNERDHQLFQEVIQFNRTQYDLLYEGRRNLNDNDTEAGIEEGNRRAQAIFQSDVEWKVGVATRVLANAHIDINLLPTVLQIVFVDMTYQGAIGTPRGAIQQALRAHDWDALSTAIDNVATSPRFINTGVQTRLESHRANINANIEGLNSAIIPEDNR